MNPAQTRYLRIVMEQMALHSRAATQSGDTDRQLRAMRSILSRVITGSEVVQTRWSQFRTNRKSWCTALREIFPHGSEVAAHVDKLESLGVGESVDAADLLPSTLVAIYRHLSLRNDVASRQLAAEIVAEDSAYWMRTEDCNASLRDARPTDNAESAGSLDDAQQGRLLQLLRRQYDEPETLALRNMVAVPGGFSKKTVLVDLVNNKKLPENLVVRHNIPGSPWAANVVTDEYPLLRVLRDAGVKVPEPWLIDTGEIMGAPLMVVSRVSGRAIADLHHFRESTAGRAACAISLAQEMAKISVIPLEKIPLSVAGRDSSPVEGMRAELDQFRTIWDQSGFPSIIIEAAFRWMYDHLEYAGTGKTLSHGDLRFHNALVDEQGVTAILDWETPTIRDPGFDLGYVYHQARQLVPWNEFLDAYREAGGKVPSPETIAFYALRAELYPAVTLINVQNGVASGAIKAAELAYVGIEMREYCMYLLSKMLTGITSGVGLQVSDLP